MRLPAILGLGLVAMMLGCGGNPPSVNLPTVHKVTGNIFNKATKQPITEGSIQFESLAQPGQVGIADVQPDGTFTMTTFIDGQRLEGLVAGAQRVTYMPRADQTEAAAVPVTLTETFEVKAGDNNFTVEVAR